MQSVTHPWELFFWPVLIEMCAYTILQLVGQNNQSEWKLHQHHPVGGPWLVLLTHVASQEFTQLHIHLLFPPSFTHLHVCAPGRLPNKVIILEHPWCQPDVNKHHSCSSALDLKGLNPHLLLSWSRSSSASLHWIILPLLLSVDNPCLIPSPWHYLHCCLLSLARKDVKFQYYKWSQVNCRNMVLRVVLWHSAGYSKNSK